MNVKRPSTSNEKTPKQMHRQLRVSSRPTCPNGKEKLLSVVLCTKLATFSPGSYTEGMLLASSLPLTAI